MSREPRTRVALHAPEVLTFDRWNGFQEDILVAVTSEEEASDGEKSLLIQYSSPGLRTYEGDEAWSFASGLLVVRNHIGQEIPIYGIDDLLEVYRTPDSCVRFPPGSRVDEYKVCHTADLHLGRQLRKKLRPGHAYTLALNRFISMRASVVEPNNSPLEPGRAEHLVNFRYDDKRIPFSVLDAAPVPRFTASLSTSSKICHSGSFSEFMLGMTVTSSSHTPVKVALPDLDRLWRALRCREWHTDQAHNSKYDLENGTSIDSSEEVIFPYGGSLTLKRSLDTILTSPPSRNRQIRFWLDGLLLDLDEWNYADPQGNIDADDRAQWPSKGNIEFEPVYHEWGKVESMFESAKPMPFFKLPREVRDMVYDFVKFAEGADEVQFTFVTD
ncbi:MAG: hypothetical protein LQ338_000005 [Usnochroma carphineum]|nr:MAG: hypothetical protein LQ338_000005 [Usnochroma carphineum]